MEMIGICLGHSNESIKQVSKFFKQPIIFYELFIIKY